MRIEHGFAYAQAMSIIYMTMRMFHVYHELYNCIAFIAKEVHNIIFFSLINYKLYSEIVVMIIKNKFNHLLIINK